jgi:IS30 family transposase
MDTYHHLTDAQRLEIEGMLKQRISLKQIAAKIGKHHSTVAREIIKRRVESNKGAVGRTTNRCLERRTCKKTQLCLDRPDCLKHCPACKYCNEKCPHYKEEVCFKLKEAPYVCNGCEQEHACVLKKRFYLHSPAHKNYREILETAREGANISEPELRELDALVSPLVAKGQSVHHILVNNPNRFSLHEKTLYRYIAGGLLWAKNGDLPRKCGLKPRKRKPVEHKIDTQCRVGRTYELYKAFRLENPETAVVEMDSIIGRVGGKCILTLQFVQTGFMLAFLREHNDAQSVIDVFAMLWRLAGPALFRRLFPLLLTDNGSEFSNPLALETAPDGTPRSRLFYCDPCASWQKPHVERNQEFVRLIRPKGTSFDDLSQTDLNTALSHINSYSRPVLHDKTPFELFTYLYDAADFLPLLGLRRLPPNDIHLKPSLIP